MDSNQDARVMGERKKCKFCEQSFTRKSNLLQHVRVKHEENKTKYKCEECDYTTLRSHDMKKHKLIHNPELEKRKSHNVFCAMCSFTCSTRSIMLRHYNLNHDIITNKECLTFESEEKFYEWKLNVEHTEKNQFVKSCRTRHVDGTLKLNFHCFRDGNFQSRGSGVHNLKIKGSNKINGHCPARMDVIFHSSGEVKVEFIKTHVGHQSELGRMKLSEADRNEIAKSIALNIPFDGILDNLKTSTSTDEVERRDLITRRDLHNIARAYNLKAKHVGHNKDSTCVITWVEEMQMTGKIVVFHKAQGSISQEFPLLKEDDFVLIIMNEIQCEMLKRYGEKCVCMDRTVGHSYGLELITLLVLDDHNQGFPCTFMFSNHTDCEMLEILLLNIRNVLGEKLKTNIFMSDIADKFFNAWLAVMDQPKFRLFCSWLVDRAWRKDLCKIKGNKEKKEEVYKVIRSLMEERYQVPFELKFKETVKRLKSDTNTSDFGEYFYREYQGTVSSWAYCYRQLTALRTNMHLERMHSVIEHIYLKGNKTKTVDIAIKALMQFMGDNLISNHKVKSMHKISAIKQRHKTSLQLDVNEIIKSDDCDLWKIFSKEENKFNEVTKVNDTCNCDLKCDECNICIHAYVCTCLDSVIKFNMCKHIHLVQKLVNQDITVNNEDNVLFISDEDSDDVQQMVIVSDLQNNEMIQHNIDMKRRRDLILNQFLNVLDAANSVNDLELINQTIRQTEATLQAQNSVQ